MINKVLINVGHTEATRTIYSHCLNTMYPSIQPDRYGLSTNVIDFGAPLPEEEYLLSKSFIDEESGQKMYLLDGWREPCTEDATGEEFVFAVCARYFGEKLDQADELFDTELTGYEVSKTLPAKPKPWWKMW